MCAVSSTTSSWIFWHYPDVQRSSSDITQSWHHTPQVKSSVPQECPHFRHPFASPRLSLVLLTNQRYFWRFQEPSPQVQQFAGRDLEKHFTISLLERLRLRNHQMKERQGARYGVSSAWGVHAFSRCVTSGLMCSLGWPVVTELSQPPAPLMSFSLPQRLSWVGRSGRLKVSPSNHALVYLATGPHSEVI